MKIFVSLAEAKATILRSLNVSTGYPVEIVIGREPKGRPERDNFRFIPEGLAFLIRFVDEKISSDKMAAIKEVRAFGVVVPGGPTSIGIKEAKDIVENWTMARPKFFELRRVPKPAYNIDGRVIGFK